MQSKYIFPFLALITLAGCASHGTMRGSVVMKADDGEAHVCLGEGEVKAGDRVALFKNVCKSSGSKAQGQVCEKVKVGNGVVERTLNEHYSVVRVDPGVVFEEGTTVEKQ